MKKHFLLQALNENGIPVYIDEVANGKNCNCICMECKTPLIAKQGNKRIHHFAHSNGTDNLKCYQTTLHSIAKTIMLEERKIPFYLKDNIEFVEVDTIQQEKNLTDIIPDIYAEYCGKPIAIEFLVSHAVDEIKKNKIQKHKITTFEIDLSKINFTTKEEIKNEIYNKQNISIIFCKELNEKKIRQKINFFLDHGEVKILNNFEDLDYCGVSFNSPYLRQIHPKKECKTCKYGFVPPHRNYVYCLNEYFTKFKPPFWFFAINLYELLKIQETEKEERWY